MTNKSMYVCFRFSTKKPLKNEIFIKNVTSCANKQRCASNNFSCDNEILLLVAAFYTPILSLWEGLLQIPSL